MTLDQVRSSFVPESDPDTLVKLLLRAIADDLAWFGGVEFDPDRTTNRVRRVAVTPCGWSWILENSGAGAFLSLEDLLDMPGQGTGDPGGQVMVNS